MIINVIQKEITQSYKNSGVKYLKTKEVANIKHKLVGPINTHFIGKAKLETDVQNLNKFLDKNKYRVEWFVI